MENKTTRVLPEEPVDKTIVISRETSASLHAEAVRAAAVAASSRREIGNGTGDQASLLSDLGDLLFPHRRTMVEETIELEEPGSDAAAVAAEGFSDGGMPTGAPLADVLKHYAVAPQPFAAGGQGRISRAVDLALGCEVALKSLHEKLCSDEHARAAFLREAKLTASLDHPAIIPIHGLFGDGGNGMHLAMKLISGHTLRTYLRTIVKTYAEKGIQHFNERKSLRNRIELFLRVCDAMEYAHSRGIIHRDLKLENIMIGKHRETYVTDWGLGIALREADRLQAVNGTPGYLAPEVLTTRKVDTRSDIYSLGIILFELVTLTPAFSEKDLPTLLALVKEGRHAPLRHRFRYRIDADLQAIIRKAIDIDPAKRYQQVAQFAEDLRRYLTNEETSARPDHFFGRICRWGVNHRRGMLMATMAALLLGIASVARTLHREIRWSTEKRYRDHAVGAAYSRVVGSANKLEKSLESIEYRLEQLRMNLLFSALKVDTPRVSGHVNRFVTIEKYRTDPPPSFRESAAYRHPIDPDGVCVCNYRPEGKVDMAALKYFGNTAEYMRRAVLDIREGDDEAAARERLLERGRPIRSIYFVLTDGTFAYAPGSRDDFPTGYFPPERVWYRRAEQSPGRMVWSGPYEDSGIHHESMLTCSVSVRGANRQPIGIAAIDFSLTQLAKKMLNPEKEYAKFIHEKMLINPEGEVIFRMVPPEREGTPVFSDAKTIRRMIGMKFGTLLARHGEREVLLAFTWLESINVLYAEVLDMTALVDRLRENSKE